MRMGRILLTKEQTFCGQSKIRRLKTTRMVEGSQGVGVYCLWIYEGAENSGNSAT